MGMQSVPNSIPADAPARVSRLEARINLLLGASDTSRALRGARTDGWLRSLGEETLIALSMRLQSPKSECLI